MFALRISLDASNNSRAGARKKKRSRPGMLLPLRNEKPENFLAINSRGIFGTSKNIKTAT